MSCQHVLKLPTNEFSALIVYHVQRPRISGEPDVFKEQSNVCCCLVVNSYNLGKICDQVDYRQGHELNDVVLNVNFPWADEIDGNISPRSKRRLSTGCLTMSSTQKLEPLTRITFSNFHIAKILQMWRAEMRPEGVGQTSGTNMSKSKVVPSHNVAD